MSSFDRPLTVTSLGHGKWRVDGGFRYYVHINDSTEYITVPDGFVTDFFSIPKALRWLMPTTQHGNQSAALHDFLYFTQTRPRKRCDVIFLEAMKVQGVSKWKRHIIYAGVRAGGWIGWNKRKKALTAKNNS